MATIPFDPTAFRAQFPQFQNTSTFPDSTLQVYFATAGLYINNQAGGSYCGGLTTAQKIQALYLMTAHLAALSVLILSGQTPGILTGATIDKISVTIEPPPAPNQWQYWLQTTPYGQQLLALLQVASVGGLYITTGAPGRAGFRFGGIN